MLRNYVKIAFRNLWRSKVFSLINVLGLATGMACSIMILLWVQDELSYDRFHTNADFIYRITLEVPDLKAAVTSAPQGPAVKAEMPEVKNVVRLRAAYNDQLFSVGERKFEEQRVFYADSTFLQVFSFPLRYGSRPDALTRPDGLLLTERMALKYFGTADALGQTIRMDNQHDFEVVGVLQDVPSNSHLQFDILLPMSFLARTDWDLINNNWDNFDFYTYLQLAESADTSPASVTALEEVVTKISREKSQDETLQFRLQPITTIHLHSRLLADTEGNGNIQYVWIFGVSAIFILLVACINFMNLATARSTRRAKEVGLRKVIGADRRQLIGQFLGESLLISLLALLLAVVLVEGVLPAFNALAGKRLTLPFSNVRFLVGLLLVALATGIVSGSYPAFFLSAFQPVKVLKGGVTKVGRGGILFRNGLVVVQFVVSIVLIVGTAVVYSQLHFIQNRNLGYDKENLLYLPLKGSLLNQTQALRAELGRRPSTSHHSLVADLPMNLMSGTQGVEWEGKDPEKEPLFFQLGVDENFLKVFRVQLLAGRGFMEGFKADSANYVLNEKALRIIGYGAEEAIGKPLTMWGNKGTIVGVVKDFNFKPAYQPVEPMILRYNPGKGYLVVRAKPSQIEATLVDLEQVWQKLNPIYPFTYGFIDQDLAKLYQAEQRMGTIFNALALLAIFISCLGLYGLAAFTAEQRTKEIGIRKVLGASVASILGLLSKDFVRLVLVAIAIATPVAWYGMSRWLSDYAYRIDLEWWVFAMAGVLALFIGLLTVSFQAVKAALMNPVKSLRSE